MLRFGLPASVVVGLVAVALALRPPRDISPYRSIHATWLRGRRVPAVSRMARYLAEAAEARLRGGG